MSSSSSGQRRTAREGFPSSPRLLERRRHQQQVQQQTQPEEEEEDDDENEDDTGADEFASDDEDSRIDVLGVSQIGVSGVSQSPSRNNNNDFSRAPTSSVSRTATARRAPTFPRAHRSMQSRGQQFRINEILSLLEAISTHLPIGSHEWEVVTSQHNKNFPDKERTSFHSCTKLFKHDFNAANNAKPKSNLNSRCQCTTNFVCLNSMSNTKKQQW